MAVARRRSPRSPDAPEVAPQLAAVETERARELDAVKRLGVWHGDVIVFDRFDDVGARSPGFLGYVLFPTCLYAVVGDAHTDEHQDHRRREPVDARPRRHDIGELCARYGGGGHAVVGGVTLRGDELERARHTVDELVRELDT